MKASQQCHAQVKSNTFSTSSYQISVERGDRFCLKMAAILDNGLNTTRKPFFISNSVLDVVGRSQTYDKMPRLPTLY